MPHHYKRIQLLHNYSEIETTSKAYRCGIQAELVARARLRHIDHLQSELQRVTAEAALQTDAAARAEAAERDAAEEAQSRAADARNECHVALHRAEKADKAVAHLKLE
jgi:hypothetical protein